MAYITDTATPTSFSAQHAELVRAVVLARVLQRLGPDDDPDRFAGREWLAAYDNELRRWVPEDSTAGDVVLWWQRQLDEFSGMLGVPSGWAELDPTEALVVSAAGLVEDDLRFGSLFASWQAPVAGRRPCVGLLRWLIASQTDERELALCCLRLARRGILDVLDVTEPRAEWVVRVPVPVWEVLQSGRVSAESLPDGLVLMDADEAPDLADVWVAEDLAAVRAHLPDMLLADRLSAVVLRGATRSGRRTLAAAAAARNGWDTLVCDHATAGPDVWRTFGALAALAPVLPLVRCSPRPDETLDLAPLPGVHRVVAISCGPSGGISGPLLENPAVIELGHCPADGRYELWRRAGLGRVTGDEVAKVSESFLVTPGNVVAAAGLLDAAATERPPIRLDAVRDAVSQLRRRQLEPLAVRLPPAGGIDPVLTDAAEHELETLLLHCRHRERLAEASASGDRGVRALFSGPSGTGKTLAARHLAGRLGLDAYRVSLAGVVNKYIGETEKNLERVLSAAEELGVVLLLDEGDSLMARRTDVGDANDRYANLETNYLLQRLEAFAGIVLITSNAASRIDQAFLRRLDVTVEFVPPTAEQRWLIWAGHLPPGHRISEPLLTEVARRCSLTGGAIRNAALHAVLLALDHDTEPDDDHLRAALRREYRRAGEHYPLGE